MPCPVSTARGRPLLGRPKGRPYIFREGTIAYYQVRVFNRPGIDETSEEEQQRHLDLTRPTSAHDSARGIARDAGLRETEVCLVEGVEEFGAKLQAFIFSDLK